MTGGKETGHQHGRADALEEDGHAWSFQLIPRQIPMNRQSKPEMRVGQKPLNTPLPTRCETRPLFGFEYGDILTAPSYPFCDDFASALQPKKARFPRFTVEGMTSRPPFSNLVR